MYKNEMTNDMNEASDDFGLSISSLMLQKVKLNIESYIFVFFFRMLVYLTWQVDKVKKTWTNSQSDDDFSKLLFSL